jgi:hypothetical protein
MSVIKAPFYMEGRYSKKIRWVDDTDNKCLYSQGRYRTKITAEDLPQYYIKCHSRSFWYSHGYVRTKGVKYIDYSYCKENHLFKDDYIYISYDKPIERVKGRWTDYIGADFFMSGNDIITLLFAIERYSPEVDTEPVWKKIQEKIDYLWEHEQDFVQSVLRWDVKPENAKEYFRIERSV